MKLFISFSLLLVSTTLFAEDVPLAVFASLKAHIQKADTPEKQAKKKLGQMLYLDKNLSKARDISCNSCHKLDSFGVDSLATSPGHKGQLGDRNSPTTFNSSLHLSQFWDGRAKDLKEQATGPMQNPVEMALASEDEIIQRVKENAEYPALFKKAFPSKDSPVSIDSVAEAIAYFEESLITPAPFDDYLEGDLAALNEEQKKGLKTFVEIGCTACHSGVLLGGSMYQKLGLVKAYTTKDTGRHKATGKDADKYFFKVPTLRNIEKTGPYLHDGSIESLDEVVAVMGEYQLGRQLTKDEVDSIVSFLGSLTGELQ